MVNFDSIPNELVEKDQWVCNWSGSKVPMQAYQRKAASASDPSTWSDFATARWAVEHGYYDYLGFVFADNGIVGIDVDVGFDNCNLVTAVGVDIMQACKSYTEKSKSGRGFHIFVKGDIPFTGKNNQSGIEIYKANRYFVTTGNRLIYGEIIQNQGAIDYILDKYFQDLPRESESYRGNRVYSPRWKLPEDGRISLQPVYPEVGCGGRNLAMTSLAGQMHSAGYGQKEIYSELIIANESACKPPLDIRELQQIVESVSKYRR